MLFFYQNIKVVFENEAIITDTFLANCQLVFIIAQLT